MTSWFTMLKMCGLSPPLVDLLRKNLTWTASHLSSRQKSKKRSPKKTARWQTIWVQSRKLCLNSTQCQIKNYLQKEAISFHICEVTFNSQCQPTMNLSNKKWCSSKTSKLLESLTTKKYQVRLLRKDQKDFQLTAWTQCLPISSICSNSNSTALGSAKTQIQLLFWLMENLRR